MSFIMSSIISQGVTNELVDSSLNASRTYELYSSHHSKLWDGFFKPGEEGMTPYQIVYPLVEESLSRYFKNTDKLPKVLDQVSGSGSFLFGFFFSLCEKYRDVEPFEIFKRCIHGWDIDKKKIKLQRTEWIKLLSEYCQATAPGDIHNAVNDNIIVNNALESNNYHMDYDIIVGNPPYQDRKNKANKLWPKFVNAAVNSGCRHIVYVTPSSLAYGEKREVSKVRMQLQNGLVSVSLNSSSYFTGIGEDISAWHWERGYSGLTTVITRDGTMTTHDFTTRFIDDKNKIFDDIEKKVMFKADKLPVSCYNGLKKQMSKTGEYLVQYSASQVLYESVQPPDYYTPKVFINRSGNYWTKKNADKYIHFMHEGVAGSLARHVLVNNEVEGKNLVELLRCKLFLLLIQLNPTKNIQFKDDIHRLPKMDITKPWTDFDVYQHFNLTPDEIAYVESMVK